MVRRCTIRGGRFTFPLDGEPLCNIMIQLNLFNFDHDTDVEEYATSSYETQLRSFWQETKGQFAKLSNWCRCRLPSSQEVYEGTRVWEQFFKAIHDQYAFDDSCLSIPLGNCPQGDAAAAIINFRDVYGYYFEMPYYESEEWLEDNIGNVIDELGRLEYWLEKQCEGVTRVAASPRKMQKSTTYQQLLFELKVAYLDPQTRGYPWVIAWSGGKDSTLVAKAVFEMIESLPPALRVRNIYINSADTGLEPILEAHIHDNLWEMGQYAKVKGLPLKQTWLKPRWNRDSLAY